MRDSEPEIVRKIIQFSIWIHGWHVLGLSPDKYVDRADNRYLSYMFTFILEESTVKIGSILRAIVVVYSEFKENFIAANFAS